MRFQNLDDWLVWLEGHHPKEIDLGLERIRQVADRLELLRPAAKVISIGGTNGKGSCVTACAALLRAAGLRVGSYTSPHLLHYCERIAVDGVPVSESEVCEAFDRIDQASDGVSLTYFEFGTLAAFEVFRRREVDVMVLEVGLGGRLDAVNVLEPDVAVVTSVDLDHQDWLGLGRESIGREKAGIYRAGRPAICADPNPPESLLDDARSMEAQLQLIGGEEAAFGYRVGDGDWVCWGRVVDPSKPEGRRFALEGPLPELPLPSLAAALQAVAQLGYDPESLNAARILSELTLPGRFQRLRWRGRDFILDVAHNPAAGVYLAERLRRETRGRVFAVVGMMVDKDRGATLEQLLPVVDVWWLASLPEYPRAATIEQLQSDLESVGAKAAGCGTVSSAIEGVLKQMQEGDRVVIMGSFFTVATALKYLLRADEMNGTAHDE